MIPWIIKNENNDKIKVIEVYDEKMNIMRINVREKKGNGYNKAKKGLKKLGKFRP